MILPILYIAPSAKGGRGVFAAEKIAKDTAVEISPVLVFSAEERSHLEKTKLYDYIFEWGEETGEVCVALGYLSMYNHDYHSNCDYDMDYEHALMKITAVRDIKKGEELCINYNADPNDENPVWFDKRES